MGIDPYAYVFWGYCLGDDFEDFDEDLQKYADYLNTFDENKENPVEYYEITLHRKGEKKIPIRALAEGSEAAWTYYAAAADSIIYGDWNDGTKLSPYKMNQAPIRVWLEDFKSFEMATGIKVDPNIPLEWTMIVGER